LKEEYLEDVRMIISITMVARRIKKRSFQLMNNYRKRYSIKKCSFIRTLCMEVWQSL